MSGIESLTYDNILTWLNIGSSVNMYNIGSNVRSVIFVSAAKNWNVLEFYTLVLFSNHKKKVWVNFDWNPFLMWTCGSLINRSNQSKVLNTNQKLWWGIQSIVFVKLG